MQKEDNTRITEIKLNPNTELAKELVPYLMEWNGKIRLMHPLVFFPNYHPGYNEMFNDQLEIKREALKKTLKDNNYYTYLFLHERYYRFAAFNKIKSRLSDRKYWELLGNLYTDAENLCEIQSQIRKLFKSKRNEREYIMDEKERKKFASLPNVLNVYRGCSSMNMEGFSWTLDKKKAEWFANRIAEDEIDTLVIKGKCNKSDVTALFLGRKEKEIVIDPKKVMQQKDTFTGELI